MKKNNWTSVEKQTISLKRKVKTLKNLGDYLKDWPEEGYFRDNISKNLMKISDCQPPRLRRYIKLIDNFIYLIGSGSDLKKLQKKKKELEDELAKKI